MLVYAKSAALEWLAIAKKRMYICSAQGPHAVQLMETGGELVNYVNKLYVYTRNCLEAVWDECVSYSGLFCILKYTDWYGTI